MSTIDEKSYSYPSDEFTQAHGEDNTKINNFAKEIKGFSNGDFIPVNAKVSYKKDQMDTLNMNIVIKYNGKTELMALTQLAAQGMLDKLPKDAKVQLQIKSESKIGSYYKRKTVINRLFLLVKRQYVNCLFILNENI